MNFHAFVFFRFGPSRGPDFIVNCGNGFRLEAVERNTLPLPAIFQKSFSFFSKPSP
jgi:hypothetical protein